MVCGLPLTDDAVNLLLTLSNHIYDFQIVLVKSPVCTCQRVRNRPFSCSSFVVVVRARFAHPGRLEFRSVGQIQIGRCAVLSNVLLNEVNRLLASVMWVYSPWRLQFVSRPRAMTAYQ